MKLAIAGATGLVGSTFLKVLADRNFKYDELILLASQKSAGKAIFYQGKNYTVEELTEHSFDKGIDIALFSAGADVSRKFSPIAAAHGCLVVDNSSAWRMDDTVPLVVPEVNPDVAFQHHNIIANPNCSTIQCVEALDILNKKYGLKRIIYNTYQAVSGAGMNGIEDFEKYRDKQGI